MGILSLQSCPLGLYNVHTRSSLNVLLGLWGLKAWLELTNLCCSGNRIGVTNSTAFGVSLQSTPLRDALTRFTGMHTEQAVFFSGHKLTPADCQSLESDELDGYGVSVASPGLISTVNAYV